MDHIPRTISLLLTESCNLSCTYCYEHHKSPRNMTFEAAKRILDRELSLCHPEQPVYIELFGGEPFMNFSLMKQVVQYVLSWYAGKIRFVISTNGTLVHGEIQEWLIAHLDYVTACLSLDGVREAHNINRSNSFDQIDLQFFLQYYPNQPIKMTISKESLPFLSQSIQFLHKLGFRIACNLAHLIDWGDKENCTMLQDQLESLIDYYLGHHEIEPCQILNFQISTLARSTLQDNGIRKYCGCGTAMKCFDLDEKQYPCQLFAPISAGDKALLSEDAYFTEIIPKEEYDSECVHCYFLGVCPICLGCNYLSTGNFYRVDKNRCKLYKMIFKANAKLQALKWEMGALTLSQAEEQALLRSILDIDKAVI